MGAVLQFCLQSYLSALLSSQTSGTDPCTAGLGFLGLAPIAQLQGTYLEDALRLDCGWKAASPTPAPKGQWGLWYGVEEVSFGPPVHTVSNLFLCS